MECISCKIYFRNSELISFLIDSMATPPSHLSHSEHSLPEMNTSSDIIEPSTPPYNIPEQAFELKSSMTNISMQPNPMYAQGVPPQRRTSQKQVVVEKINEGNPDAKSPSANIVSNVKIYERLDSIFPSKLGLSPRYSYSPNRKTDRDSVYQYLGSISADPKEALAGLPLSLPSSKSNSITRLCLQIFFSVVLIITLFIAVVALVTAILSISASNSQTEASLEVARKLESLSPLINANSTYSLLLQNISATQNILNAFRNETLHSIAALQVANNCSVQVSECVVAHTVTTCTTDNIALDISSYRLTGMSCVTSDLNAEATIAVTNASYSCLCKIALLQPDWTCKLSLFLCSTGN